MVIGGWGGLSKVTTLSTLSGEIDRGTQSVWNWAVSLSFPDLGKEGNLGGIVVGAEPWVTSSSINSLGEDENMSLHLEAFYLYRLSDNLAITPGIIWITAPDNSDRENDLAIRRDSYYFFFLDIKASYQSESSLKYCIGSIATSNLA